jgi:hypothetical protein
MSAPALLGCPHCNRPISFAPELAGQVVACPHCRKQLQMPATPPGPPPVVNRGPPPRGGLSSGSAPTAPFQPDDDLRFPDPPDGPAGDARTDPGRPAVEPLSFRRAELVSAGFMWCGVAGALAVAVLLIVHTAAPMFRGDAKLIVSGILYTGGVLLFFAAACFGFVLVRTATLVLIDAARNLRAVRQSQPPGK